MIPCCEIEPLISATRLTILAKVALTVGSETLMRSACDMGTPVGVMNLTNERLMEIATRITSKLTLGTVSIRGEESGEWYKRVSYTKLSKSRVAILKGRYGPDAEDPESSGQKGLCSTLG